MATDLDRAWEAINALGGVDDDNTYARGFNDAIGLALIEIEKLGGRDPCTLPPIPTDAEIKDWLAEAVKICRPVK